MGKSVLRYSMRHHKSHPTAHKMWGNWEGDCPYGQIDPTIIDNYCRQQNKSANSSSDSLGSRARKYSPSLHNTYLLQAAGTTATKENRGWGKRNKEAKNEIHNRFARYMPVHRADGTSTEEGDDPPLNL